MNIRSVSARHEGLNSKVERLNGTIRDRGLLMRGRDHKESARELMEAMRIYHNYIEPHQGSDDGFTEDDLVYNNIISNCDDGVRATRRPPIVFLR
jgi:hypothetical protein